MQRFPGKKRDDAHSLRARDSGESAAQLSGIHFDHPLHLSVKHFRYPMLRLDKSTASTYPKAHIHRRPRTPGAHNSCNLRGTRPTAPEIRELRFVLGKTAGVTQTAALPTPACKFSPSEPVRAPAPGRPPPHNSCNLRGAHRGEPETRGLQSTLRVTAGVMRTEAPRDPSPLDYPGRSGLTSCS